MIRINWQRLKLMFMLLLGLILCLYAPTLKAQVVSILPQNSVRNINHNVFLSQEKGTEDDDKLFLRINPQNLLQQGIQAYQNQDYQKAIALWQQAVNSFATTEDNLNKGLVLSNLSLAYQHLGQWEPAQEAINNSLKVLNTRHSESSQTHAEILAKTWNSQGRLYWQQGKLQDALSAWQKATYHYTVATNQEGIIGTQLNQVKVLQALGLNLQARELVSSVQQNLQFIKNYSLKADGFRELGISLRQVGELRESEQVLQQGLALSHDPNLHNDLLLELGNTERALEQKYLSIGKIKQAQEHREAALSYYQKVEKNSSGNEQVLSLVNQFSLLIDSGKWESALNLFPNLKAKITQLSPSRNTIYAYLNFAHHATCLKQSIDNRDFSCINSAHRARLPEQNLMSQTEVLKLNTPSWPAIAQLIATAINQSQSLEDSLIQSLAVGQLGRLYEINQQWNEAQKLTQQALLTLEEIQAPELRYRWEWQLGRLLKKQNKREEAISAYTAAIDSLKSVRADLLIVNSEIQFGFRDQVEPVYRELVYLLLTQNNEIETPQENLRQAIEQIDALQIAELENFLGCDLKNQISVQENLNQIDAKAVLIYPIILADRLEVIVQFPERTLIHHQIPVSQNTVKKAIALLRLAILRRNAGEVTQNATAIYQWLIEPIEKDLQEFSDLETLVFVLDGELRNIPLGVLYDAKNEQYLIEKPYAVALLPSSKLFDTTFKKSEQLRVLGAGISEGIEAENRYFSPLNVIAELKQIEEKLSSKILLNNEFTVTNLQNNLNQNDYSIIHLATHGNFSSDPTETFILAHSSQEAIGQLLRPNDINSLLRRSEENSLNSINLLVLSACQTALGDNRATLGLAGLAVRSGAQSTLATLWQVSDQSTVRLMETFYSQLNQPGVSKAQALHLAQQTLLKEQKYQNPYYWAAYVLVGNWR